MVYLRSTTIVVILSELERAYDAFRKLIANSIALVEVVASFFNISGFITFQTPSHPKISHLSSSSMFKLNMSGLAETPWILKSPIALETANFLLIRPSLFTLKPEFCNLRNSDLFNGL